MHDFGGVGSSMLPNIKSCTVYGFILCQIAPGNKNKPPQWLCLVSYTLHRANYRSCISTIQTTFTGAEFMMAAPIKTKFDHLTLTKKSVGEFLSEFAW